MSPQDTLLPWPVYLESYFGFGNLMDHSSFERPNHEEHAEKLYYWLGRASTVERLGLYTPLRFAFVTFTGPLHSPSPNPMLL